MLLSFILAGLSRLGRLGPRKLEKAASQSPLEGAPLAEPNIEAAKPQGKRWQVQEVQEAEFG